ncbi:hypothetical protein [Haladaptatus sp. CMAA 1911]|uniref:hypothetical protein n=1 Tax=unclassified Haladaptatus TaxID=2622732 RepID=UPI003754AED4
MSTTTGNQLERASMERLEWIGVVLSVLMGLTYFFEAAESLPSMLGLSFLLAGLGYVGAIVLALVDFRRSLLYVAGVVYNLLLIGVYFLIRGVNDPELVGPHGAAKLLQVVFVILLLVLIIRKGQESE